MRAVLLGALLLAGCGDAEPEPAPRGAGAALEAAAARAGMIADTADPTGLYASETDHVCIVPAAGGYRIGATTEFADGQGCSAYGTASGTSTLAVRLGGECSFDASFDGERLRFPTTLPAACDRSCRGRATFAALTASRLSGSVAEASAMRDRAGAQPCSS